MSGCSDDKIEYVVHKKDGYDSWDTQMYSIYATFPLLKFIKYKRFTILSLK